MESLVAICDAEMLQQKGTVQGVDAAKDEQLVQRFGGLGMDGLVVSRDLAILAAGRRGIEEDEATVRQC